jgi:hypothetical protein
MPLYREVTNADLAACLDQAPHGYSVEVRYPGSGTCYAFHTWKVEADMTIYDITARKSFRDQIISSIDEINQLYHEMVIAHGSQHASIECYVDPSGIGCGLQYLITETPQAASVT